LEKKQRPTDAVSPRIVGNSGPRANMQNVPVPARQAAVGGNRPAYGGMAMLTPIRAWTSGYLRAADSVDRTGGVIPESVMLGKGMTF